MGMQEQMVGCFAAEKAESWLFILVGVGLVMQASLMLVLDLFAEKRGDEYLLALRALPTASAPAAGEAPGQAAEGPR
ncbi:hypothetical protein ACN28I_19895 [Archangium gephyra]|uniref:hypothetical protein n=1 Tax=Archangium gephyra TaxID=48 RepID=UPI003B7D4916